MKIGIIGTAGRDKSIPMRTALWVWMLKDCDRRVMAGDTLVSGGAAWADHLAVALFLAERVEALVLHLPSPFSNGRFVGPSGSAASAANYYHERFSQALGVDTRNDITLALAKGAEATYEPAQAGYAGMFARNLKVAKAKQLIAYTFGEGEEPADGGTKDTWNKCQGIRIHVTLPKL